MKNLKVTENLLKLKKQVVAGALAGVMLVSGATEVKASAKNIDPEQAYSIMMEQNPQLAKSILSIIGLVKTVSLGNQDEYVEVKNIDKKCASLKKTMNTMGLSASDETVQNVVRILHSDFVAHDGYKEILDVDYERAMSLLASIGSYNNVVYGAKFNGYISGIEQSCYIPTDVFPEEHKEYLDKFTKLSDKYAASLNKIEMGESTLTEAEEQAIVESIQKELDKYNIEDINEYVAKFEELYNKAWEETYNKKYQTTGASFEKSSKGAYKSFWKEFYALIKDKEYLKLTPSEKIIIFTNINGAVTSGVNMNEKYLNKFMDFQSGIEQSINDGRTALVRLNRENNKRISQKEAIAKIVKENEEKSKMEVDNLGNLMKEYEGIYESGKAFLR